jgi:predicted nucleotide-binding protein (sugar kinase/HSP70/actin superfamily)
MEKKGCIGIPKALMYYRYFPLWCTFFEELGWRVRVSDRLGKTGRIIYFEDSCLPMKLLVTHAVSLKEEVDYLFVPRLVSVHRIHMMCPKFRGAPDIVRLATERKVSMIDETVDLRTRKNSFLSSFLRIGEKLGASKKETKQAFAEGEKSYFKMKREWIERINRLPLEDLFKLKIPTPETRKESILRVAFVGHPYNLFDRDINKDILTLTRDLGMEIFTSDLLSETEMDRQISDLSKEIYWSSGREIVGALFHFLKSGVDGVVFLTSFKCGIDALLQEFIKRRLKVQGGSAIPFLVLSFDEHTGREGLVTRLEAFRDVMESRKELQSKVTV